MNIFFVSLGCDKNLVDSEMMITSLRKDSFEIIDREEEADIIVVNTCCFIGDEVLPRTGSQQRSLPPLQ